MNYAKFIRGSLAVLLAVTSIPVWGAKPIPATPAPRKCSGNSSKCKVIGTTVVTTGLAAFAAHRFTPSSQVSPAATQVLTGQTGHPYFDADVAAQVNGERKSNAAYWDEVRSQIRQGNRNLNITTEIHVSAAELIESQNAAFKKMERAYELAKKKLESQRADFAKFSEQHAAWQAAPPERRLALLADMKTIPDLKLNPILAASYDQWVSQSIEQFDREQAGISALEKNAAVELQQIESERRAIAKRYQQLTKQNSLVFSDSIVIGSDDGDAIKFDTADEAAERNAAAIEAQKIELEAQRKALTARAKSLRGIAAQQQALDARRAQFEARRTAYLEGRRPLSELPKTRAASDGIDGGFLDREHMQLALQEEQRALAQRKSSLETERTAIASRLQEIRAADGTRKPGFINLSQDMSQEEALRLVNEAEAKPGTRPIRMTQVNSAGAKAVRGLRNSRGAVVGIVLSVGALIVLEEIYVGKVTRALDRKPSAPTRTLTKAPATFGRSTVGAD